MQTGIASIQSFFSSRDPIFVIVLARNITRNKIFCLRLHSQNQRFPFPELRDLSNVPQSPYSFVRNNRSKYFIFTTVSLETNKGLTAMALKAECAWARVCIRQTKEMCSSLKRSPEESTTKFGHRVLAERHHLYSEHFKDYAQFTLSKYDFSRACKIIDEKIANWRNKGDKETYLTTFSMANWNEGKNISKEMKKAHSLSNCKSCFLLNSNLQATFPLSKMCMTAKRGPLGEIQGDVKRLTAQPAILKISKR